MIQPRKEPANRGQFSISLGRTLATAAALGLAAQPVDAQRSTAVYSNTTYVVAIPGENALRPMGLTGGDVVGEVILDPQFPSNKLIGRVAVTPLTLRIDPLGLPSWVIGNVNEGPAPRDIAVVLVDTAGQVQHRRELFNTAITGIAFPQLDATIAAQTAALTLRLVPAALQYSGGGASPVVGAKTAAWTGAFRLTLAQLPTNQVVRVAPFAWTRTAPATQTEVTELDRRQQQPSATSVENLKLEIALAALPTWQAWAQSFLLGKPEERQELSGGLELLGGSGERILEVALDGVGLVSLTMPTMNNVTASTFGIELYVDRITIKK